MLNKIKIMIIEDEDAISNFIATTLKANTYAPLVARSASEALSMIPSHCPDLILLDLGLPDMDGIEILKKIREWSSTPVIVVSARGEESDKVEALDLGADDYISKPYSINEVMARVKSQIRRYVRFGGSDNAAKSEKSGVLRNGGLELDDNSKTFTRDGEPISLTPTEMMILKFFMENLDKVFSPKELYRKVWGDDPLGAENTVTVHIRHLREKIEIDPANPDYLKVSWGHGYKMVSKKVPEAID